MTALLNLLGVIASLGVSFVCSGMETALYRVSRVRMRIRSDRGERRARAVLRVLDRLDAMVTTILVGNNIAAYSGAYFVTAQMALWRVPHAELITTAIVTPIFFVLTESLPKQIAYNRADSLTTSLIRVFSAFRAFLKPMVILLNSASFQLRRLLGASGEAHLSQSQRSLLLEHLNAGVAENLLTAEQSRMAERIMELEGTSAGNSMIPLERLARIPAAASRSQAVSEMRRRRAQLVLLMDANGRPTGESVSLGALIMTPGAPGDPVRPAAERLERIQAKEAIPEVLNLFRTRHARHALVENRGRIVGIITTQTVLDRIAGISR